MAAVEIKPVTRIEGDGKLELETYLDAGKLKAKNLITPNDGTLVLPTDNAARYPKFCVTEFRGFEKVCTWRTARDSHKTCTKNMWGLSSAAQHGKYLCS